MQFCDSETLLEHVTADEMGPECSSAQRGLNMSMRCAPDALRFTGIQKRSHITRVCCKAFMNILGFLSDLFYDVVSCLAGMGVWTGCLLPAFIKPSVEHYICRNENGAASPSQLPSSRGAAKWHKTVRCGRESYGRQSI